MTRQSTTFRIAVRTAEEKTDLRGSWARRDEEFFGSGACHVLAGAFLELHPELGFRAFLIQPAAGFRGSHVIAANDALVFDCRGWNARHEFLSSYAEALGAIQPGWSSSLVSVADPLGREFCATHAHRRPSQFFRDPLPRARAFVRAFPMPCELARR